MSAVTGRVCRHLASAMEHCLGRDCGHAERHHDAKGVPGCRHCDCTRFIPCGGVPERPGGAPARGTVKVLTLRSAISSMESIEPARYVLEVRRGDVRIVAVMACGGHQCGELLPLFNGSFAALRRLARSRGWTWSQRDDSWLCAACSPNREVAQ